MTITPQLIEKAEEQIFREQQEVAYDTREFTIEHIVNKYKIGYPDDNEIYVPDYQRDFVWDELKQSKFIESIILGLPVPFIFVAEIKETGRFEIVDGSQRIRTLAAFLDNNLVLEGLEKLTNLNGFSYPDLSIPRQRKLKNTPIRMVVLTDKTSEESRTAMFERINIGGESLRDMEKRKGLLKGDFTNFIYEKCARNKDFLAITPIINYLEKRQEREELILRFFALSETYLNYPSHTGIAKYLNDYLEKKNKELSELTEIDRNRLLETYYTQFSQTVLFVRTYFPNGFAKSNIPGVSRIYAEAISVGACMALKENLGLSPTPESIKSWLQSPEFRQIVQGKYETHSPKRIKERIEFVKTKLLGL